MADFEGVVFLAAFGTLNAGAVTGLKAQQGLQANLSDAADLAGTALAIADTADNKLLVLDVFPPGRALRPRRGNARHGGRGDPWPHRHPVRTGPKTANGRARSAQNAFKHGLTLHIRFFPEFSAEIEALAAKLWGRTLMLKSRDLPTGRRSASRRMPGAPGAPSIRV